MSMKASGEFTRAAMIKLLNEMNTRAAKAQLGSLLENMGNRLVAKYSFAVQGGAVGDIALVDDQGNPATLPINAVVTDVLVDVITPATSGGSATVAIKSNGAADLLGATAVASITGKLDGIPVSSAATAVKMTAERTLYATVAVAALTAGKFNVIIDYVISE